VISFFAPGLPVGQPRTKATRRGSHAGVYTPSTADAWKAAVAAAAVEAGAAPVVEDVRCSLRFAQPRPKGHYRTGRRAGELRDDLPPFPRRFDLDNLVKAVLDALRGIAWADDCQVQRLTVSRRWAAPGDTPGVVIEVERMVEP